jgi:probable HAF family extracellular repeat protein
MDNKLLHFIAILALAFLAGKCELLTAQSGNIKRSGVELPGLHHGLALANSHADSGQPPQSHSDPGAEGMARTKVYKFRSIDYPGAHSSFVHDFNGKTAVGEFYGTDNAFTFHGSSYLPLSVPGAILSAGYGINTSGTIVGEYEDSSGNVHGFLYDGNRYTTIDYPGSRVTQAWDINDAGVIVGGYTDSSNAQHGFLYDKGTFTAINFPGADNTSAYGINSGGDIVGVYGSAHGFLLTNGVYSAIVFPETGLTSPVGINDAGDIAGDFLDGNGVHGFTYSLGTFTQVDVPGAYATFLRRIKNNGNVVGFVYDNLSEIHGVIGH